ncbi:hypothetical protein ACFIOY_15315 [Bradyrhizobium sp. TZ2]
MFLKLLEACEGGAAKRLPLQFENHFLYIAARTQRIAQPRNGDEFIARVLDGGRRLNNDAFGALAVAPCRKIIK